MRGRRLRLAHGFARLLFGAWFLYAGVEYFTPFALQPLGQAPLAREFTAALIHSGLFAWVKVIEAVVGALLLANRAVLAAALAALPLSVVIFYWNVVLEPGGIGWMFGVATLGLNLVLLLPFGDRLRPLLAWRVPPAG